MSILKFKKFMSKQIIEIKKYKRIKLMEDPGIDQNKCVFDWIDKNASSFYKNFNK